MLPKHCEVLCGLVASQGVNAWSVTTCSRLVCLQPVLHSWPCYATEEQQLESASVDDGFNTTPLTCHCALLLKHCYVSIGAQQTLRHGANCPVDVGACKCCSTPGVLLPSTHHSAVQQNNRRQQACVYLRNQGWQCSFWPSGLLLAPSQFLSHPAATLFCNHCNTRTDLPWCMLG